MKNKDDEGRSVNIRTRKRKKNKVGRSQAHALILEPTEKYVDIWILLPVTELTLLLLYF